MSISIGDSASALTEADMAAVEQRLRVKFPDDYRALKLLIDAGLNLHARRSARFQPSRSAAEFLVDFRKGNGLAELEAYSAERGQR